MLSKDELYELYWGEGLSLHEIAEQSEHSHTKLRERMTELDIPNRGPLDLQRWIEYMTTVAIGSRRDIYRHYWVYGRTQRETAEQLGWSKSFVELRMTQYGIPTREKKVKRSSDPEEIPPTYQWPTEDTEQKRGSMPEDPDPSKYLVDVPDLKDEIYQLYWGYGLGIEQINARLSETNTPREVRGLMERFNIPTRYSWTTTQWRPMDGIPPEYEWPESERDQLDWSYQHKRGNADD